MSMTAYCHFIYAFYNIVENMVCVCACVCVYKFLLMCFYYINKWIVNYAMRNIRPRRKCRSEVHFSLILNKFA